MKWTFPEGRSGKQCLYEGKSLHSTYNPVSEAEKWAQTFAFEAGTLVFLCGDALGYAAAALEKLFPRLRVLRLVPHADCNPRELDWIDATIPLSDFLLDEFEKTGPQDVRWEVWPAFERLCPELSKKWGETFRSVYRQVQGSWLTFRQFGRSFWKNTIRNLVDWERPVRVIPGSRPVVIAASGPSLERSIPWIEEFRDSLELWALPSSFCALLERGLIPDLAVSTDGGYYAREHLRILARTQVPIACAASGASDPSISDLPKAIFSQAYEVERILLPLFVPQALEIGSQGTVAVTAIKLALASTSADVFVCGMDLCYQDLQAHARPHSTERLLTCGVQRANPWESILFERTLRHAPTVLERGRRTSSAMVTYAAWLDSGPRFDRSVYRIDPSPVTWASMQSAKWKDFASRKSAGGTKVRLDFLTPDSWPNRRQRGERVRSALQKLAKEIETSTLSNGRLERLAQTLATRELMAELKTRRASNADTDDLRVLAQACRKEIEALTEGIPE